MRDIKFRAWDKINKDMLILHRIDFDGSVLLGVGVYDGEDWGRWRAKDIELMQYTGLKDKNGKEIYEGDFVIRYSVNNTEYKYEVLWGRYGWSAKQTWSGMYRDLGEINPEYECEVVGNIYENPELLNPKEVGVEK